MRAEIIKGFFATGVLFAILGTLFTWIAFKFHFFRIKALPAAPFSIKHPIWGFLGYLLIFFGAAPLTLRLAQETFKELLGHSPILLMTLMQMMALAFVIIYLTLFSLLQPPGVLHRLWIHPMRSNVKSLLQDFGLGVLCWLIAFPVVAFISQFVELFTYLITGISGVEQLAIRYLKAAADSPFLLIVALFTIIIAAPIIEEFIFRGILFSYLKKRWGFMKGLLLSALIFSLFHFSPAQGVGNIALLSSLFVLSLYLGFLYERQGSLVAPIALHMTFNSISVMRILIFSN